MKKTPKNDSLLKYEDRSIISDDITFNEQILFFMTWQ